MVEDAYGQGTDVAEGPDWLSLGAHEVLGDGRLMARQSGQRLHHDQPHGHRKEYYGEEERESMLPACSRITFHLRRAKGEKAQAFMLRWDDAERRVKEKGVHLPGEYQGFSW